MSFVDIPAPHGRLEALFWRVEGARGAAVVCHPHPLHGGTMHNHVAYRIADAFRQAKVSALRFNFRGVGRSTGTYDEGRGEVDDARAALDFLQQAHPGLPLHAGGFSFGARVALTLAAEEARVERVLAVGLPLRLFDHGFLRQLSKPKAFIHSEQDELAPVEDVRALVHEVPPPKQLYVLADADHLCTGRLDALAALATEAVQWLLADVSR